MQCSGHGLEHPHPVMECLHASPDAASEAVLLMYLPGVVGEALVLESLPPAWETQAALPALLALHSPGLCWSLGSDPVDTRPDSASHSAFQIK